MPTEAVGLSGELTTVPHWTPSLLDLLNLEVHDDRPIDIECRRGLIVLGLVVCPIRRLRLVW